MEAVQVAQVESVTTMNSIHPEIIGVNGVMVKCNYSRNVYKHIETGKYYIIDMPNIKTVLKV